MNKRLPSPRKQRNREATIQSMLDAARTIMREEGVAALSMQELARRMEMRSPSLYNYFSSKMDIYDTLFRVGISRYDAHLEEMLKTAAGIRDEIRIGVESYMTFALAHPELFHLCFERPVPGFVPSQTSLELSFGMLNKAYARVSQFAPDLNPKVSPRQVVDLVIAVAHGLTALHLANEPNLPSGQGRFGSLTIAAVSMLEATLLVQGVIE
ncbi:MAG: TetR/AcrR family transcriptional regulator [Thermoflexales bacterium]